MAYLADRATRPALSFAQQRLWFLDQLAGPSPTYLMPMAVRLRGPLDTLALRRSLATLIERHEALRSRFITIDGEPRLALIAPERALVIREHDLSHEPDAEASLQQLVDQEAREPFDLATGPLIRVRLLRLAAHDHVLLITQHHIVTDGWSMAVFCARARRPLRAFAAGRDDPLPAAAIQYADYAAWQRQWLDGERAGAPGSHTGARTLGGAPALLELPTDRPRPARAGFAGADLPFALDRRAHAPPSGALARRHGATLFMTLLAAFGRRARRATPARTTCVVGTPIAEPRPHASSSR